MKKHLILTVAGIFALGGPISTFGQKQAIEASVERKEAISHFRYLASDELKGRDAMRSEIDVAARYIAEQFLRYGAKELPEADRYYHPVPLKVSVPPTVGDVKLGTETIVHGEDMLVLDGAELSGSYPMVVAGHGLAADLEGKDLQGKILVVRVGAPDRMTPSELFAAGRKKMALAKSKGAVGIIELYNLPTTPWNLLVNYLNKPQLTIDSNPNEDAALPYLWVKDLSNELIAAIDQGKVKEVAINVN